MEKRVYNFKDLTGQRFGKLTVLNLEKKEKGITIWKCQCDCGNITHVTLGHLRSGDTKSCGCLRHRKKQDAITKDKLYTRYRSMISRCYYPSHTHYKNYGGRGIRICNEWLGENGFLNFRNWALSNGFEDGLTIDRINNNGNYEPDNCRWATKSEQLRNYRKNHFITIDGITKTMTEWAENYNLDVRTIDKRLKRGWKGRELLQPSKRVLRDV